MQRLLHYVLVMVEDRLIMSHVSSIRLIDSTGRGMESSVFSTLSMLNSNGIKNCLIKAEVTELVLNDTSKPVQAHNRLKLCFLLSKEEIFLYPMVFSPFLSANSKYPRDHFPFFLMALPSYTGPTVFNIQLTIHNKM